MSNNNNNKDDIVTLQNELELTKAQIQKEKDGKRKLFQSLVKIANELKKTRHESTELMDAANYANQTWYEGGLWRAPQVLPTVEYATMKRGDQQQQQQPEEGGGSKTTSGGTSTTKPPASVAAAAAAAASPAGSSMIGGVPVSRGSFIPGSYSRESGYHAGPNQGGKMRTRLREAISLSDLFFDLVMVTSFTRVGVVISKNQDLDGSNLAYFAVFWTIWSKEASYSSRFDTTDLSAQVETLLACFAILFGSLSCDFSINSHEGGTRIMVVAAFVALMHFFLHVRILYWNLKEAAAEAIAEAAEMEAAAVAAGNGEYGSDHSNDDSHPSHMTPKLAEKIRLNTMQVSVRNYALLNITMNLCEVMTWLIGILLLPVNHKHRWVVFLMGILFALRVPRAFLANDFHAACSKRGVLFILLLGFLLQSIVVVASEFFTYTSPTFEQYSFIGAACLLMFCIKLLYVDDSDTMAEDHAMLVNRIAGFCFNVGHFALLLSTTVMGSGLNLLTHNYLAATAALPGQAKYLVIGGFSATVLSMGFIKSMHVKRIPAIDTSSSSSRRNDRNLFIGAYLIQIIATMVIVILTGFLAYDLKYGSMGYGAVNFLQVLVQNDIKCLFLLCGMALFLVIVSWLDEAVELTLYSSVQASRYYRVSPFGIWFCLKPEVTEEEIQANVNGVQGSIRVSSASSLPGMMGVGPHSGMSIHGRPSSLAGSGGGSNTRLSILSPLLGSSIADLKAEYYKSLESSEGQQQQGGGIGGGRSSMGSFSLGPPAV